MKNRNGKLFVILAAVLLLVMSFAISTFAGDSQNYWVTQSLNVSTYRANTDTNGHYTKYPTCTLTGYEGYVFAGWFTDETCETPYTKATGTAYAKFVPEEIFGTKAQVLGTLVDDDRTNDETGAIRFVTSVDSLDYLGIGFEVYYNGATTPSYISTDTTTVYQNLYAVGKAGTGKAQAFDATVFHANSQYLKTVTFTELPAAKYAKTLEAKPFWITLDGTKVVADGDVRCVNEGRKYIVVNATAAQNGVGTEKSPFNNLEDAMALATGKNKVAETSGVDAVVYLKSDVTANKEYAMDNNKKVVIQSSKAVTITRGDAITGSTSAGYNVFAVNTGTLSIQGTATNEITIEGNTGVNVRAFAVGSGATLDVDNVTVQNFTKRDNGGAFHVEGTVTVDGGTISGNVCNDGKSGGAFFVANTGKLTINSGTIQNNEAKIGAAIAMEKGDANNKASTVINGGSITGNTATMSSGAVNIHENAILTITGGTISGNDCIDYPDQKGIRVYKSTSALNMSGSAHTDYIYLQDDASAITLTGDLSGAGNMTVLCKNYTEGRTIINAEGSATTANTAKFKLENNGKILKQSEDKKTAYLYVREVWNQTKDAGYESLNAAVAAVTDNTATTLVVQKDLTQTAVVNIGDSNETKRNITIIDDGTAHTISRGTNTGRFFRVYNGADLTLTTTTKNDKTPLLTLDGTNSGTDTLDDAQFVYTAGTLNVDAGVVMQNNNITASGGAINVAGGGTATINGGLITGNETAGDGGAIYVNGTVCVKGGTFTANKSGSAKSGGAFYLTKTGDLTIEDGTISNNQAKTGGAIAMAASGTAKTTINGGSITGNTATGNGGAINVLAASTLNVNGGTISGNTCTADAQKGVRIHAATSALNISGSAYIDYIYLQNDASAINLTGNLTADGNMIVLCMNYAENRTIINQGTYTTTSNMAKFKIGNSSYGLKQSESLGAYLYPSKVRNATTGVEYETLAEAIAAVEDGGTATVEILTDITLNEVIEIGDGTVKKNITITDGGNSITISRGANTGRFFRVYDGSSLTLTTTTKNDNTPLLVLDGTSNSALKDAQFVYTKGTLNVNAGVVMKNNSITAGGGAVNVAGGGNVKINGGLITHNQTTGNGGAFYVANTGKLTVAGGTISQNQAKIGGAIAMVEGTTSNKASTTISGGSITGNTATGSGGAVNIHGYATLTMTGGTISANNCTDNPDQKGIRLYQNTSTLNMRGAAYADYIYLQNSSVITLKGDLTTSKKMSIICQPCTSGDKIITGDYVTATNVAKFQMKYTFWKLSNSGVLSLDTSADVLGILMAMDSNIAAKSDSVKYTNYLAFIQYEKNRVTYDNLNGITMNVIGDSYFHGYGLDQRYVWPALVAEKNDMTFVNKGISGSTISNYVTNKNPMVDRYDSMPDNNPHIVIIEGGRNDYSQDVPIGTNTSKDTETFKGALNTLIDGIQAKYPNALILATTVWETGTKTNSLGHVCSDYGDALIEICKLQDVPVWNAMDQEATGVYMTEENFRANYCLGENDISHMNMYGMMKVMPVFEKWISEQYAEFLK